MAPASAADAGYGRIQLYRATPFPPAGSRPISASGISSGEPVVMARPVSAMRPQEFKTEYERSFTAFDKYAYRNGKWSLVRPSQGPAGKTLWLDELVDNRKRAVENRARSRGDHFSKEHMMQIPSAANAFWESPDAPDVYPPAQVVTESLVRPGTYRVNTVKSKPFAPSTETHVETFEVVDRSRRAGADPVNNTLVMSTPVLRSVSQGTQTLPEIHQLPTGLTHGREMESEAVQVDLDVGPSDEGISRIDLLRRAKYFDPKDNFSSLPIRLPRSSSNRTISEGHHRDRNPSPMEQGSNTLVVRSRTDSFAEYSKAPPRNGVRDDAPPVLAAGISGNGFGEFGHDREPYKEMPAPGRTRLQRDHLPVSSPAAMAFSVSPPPRHRVKESGSSSSGPAEHRRAATKASSSWTILADTPKKVGQSRLARSAVNSRSTCLRAAESTTANSSSKSHAWTEL